MKQQLNNRWADAAGMDGASWEGRCGHVCLLYTPTYIYLFVCY